VERIKKDRFTTLLKAFDFGVLFNELGWDHFKNKLPLTVNETALTLQGIAQKKGFAIFLCEPLQDGTLPLRHFRQQLEKKTAKHHYEHLIIYADIKKSQQIWQLAVKEENKPRQVKEINWHAHQDSEILFQRLRNLFFTLNEEDTISIVDVTQRVANNFAINTEKITKKFYTEFKKQHGIFLKFIEGVDDHLTTDENLNKQWYASLMLNRLMFCYFIQKKGFLDKDTHYLKNKLALSIKISGSDNFYSFYRGFLLELFHDGLGKPEVQRNVEIPIPLGKIPYLNGGLFNVHELEQRFKGISIPDEAFQSIFDFFDDWNWHLDTEYKATGRDINPDVIGYIFEKYINDRAAMGAYYTKEDITDYIGKNTILPFLLNYVEGHINNAFKPEASLWQFLKHSGDTYINDAVKYGVPEDLDLFNDLPQEIQAGFNPEIEYQLVKKDANLHLWEQRKPWSQKAPEDIALPTETYREVIVRHLQCSELRAQIKNGNINSIDEFITYNLNVRQFVQDYLERTDDSIFIRHYYQALEKITILDPTVGSGAFLFAALNNLEPLYEICLERMEYFCEEEPGQHPFFEKTLDQINSTNHPNTRYFIYKSIILNNLYGVDIMKEAVEIAKLRLFLKLVASVDVNSDKPNCGLEPLPDIDFNIRAGNTLVGFASESKLFETIDKKEALFSKGKLEYFKEECKLCSELYDQFQDSQLIADQDPEKFNNAKAKLVEKLSNLNNGLNEYLANNYGIDRSLMKQIEIEVKTADGKKVKKKVNQYDHWLENHQPFHWFAEFYHIVVGNGGFDVIIGNPPYLEIKSVEKRYKIQGLFSHGCGNLYAPVMERSYQISTPESRFGVIVPISFVSAQRMKILQDHFREHSSYLWLSSFALRPASLFPGVMQRLTICLAKRGNDAEVFTTEYLTWYSEERGILFDRIKYLPEESQQFKYSLPKISDKSGATILSKVLRRKSKYISKQQFVGPNIIYYHNAGGYWIKTFRSKPHYRSLNIPGKKHTTISGLKLPDKEDVKVYFALLNSSLFYLFWKSVTDARHLYPSDIALIPIEIPFQEQNMEKIGTISDRLVDKMDKHKNRIIYGKAEVDQYSIAPCKYIIDMLDEILAIEYGFTEGELDFIVNYDIKYRMGKDLYQA
jgi:hypothetical protein